MSRSLVENVEMRAWAADDAFAGIEAALNQVLPESAYHLRYRSIGEVGLATIVARDFHVPGLYDPFVAETPDALSFMATNRDSRPEAWKPMEVDERMLGGPVPEWLGRFGAFALAKVNLLSNSAPWKTSSHRINTDDLKPGEFGNAGGQRFSETLLAVSGLWEVHDHVVGSVFKHQAETGSAGQSSSDTLAELFEATFEEIQQVQQGVPAEKLDRRQVSDLLKKADGIVARRLVTSYAS